MKASKFSESQMVYRPGRPNPYMAGLYVKLLDKGRRILPLHLDYIHRTHEAKLLTDEHEVMISSIRNRDVERANQVSRHHTRLFRDNLLRQNYASGVKLDL